MVFSPALECERRIGRKDIKVKGILDKRNGAG